MELQKTIRKGRVRPVNNFVEFVFLVPKKDLQDKIRLISKILVIIFLLAGSFYQISDFLQLYLKYPTVMDFDISYPEFIEAPALTVCNSNGLRRVPWCRDNPDKCHMTTRGEEVCEADPVLCQNRSHMANYMVPLLDLLEMEVTEGPCDDVDRFGHRAEDMLHSCYVSWAKDVDICRPERVQKTITYGFFEVVLNCFVINSQLDREPTKASSIPLEERDDGNYIRMVLDLEPFEYFQPKRPVEAILGIHGALQLPNVMLTGFTVEPGKAYTIYVTPKVTHLLTAPFASNCTDYHALWLATNKTGYLLQEQCTEACIIRYVREKCNCFAMIGMHLRSNIKENENLCMRSNRCYLHLNTSHCYQVCAKDCVLNTFDYKFFKYSFENAPEYKPFDEEFGVHNIGIDKEDQDMFIMRLNKSMMAYEPLFSKDRYVQLTIKLAKPQLSVYTEKPKFESIEVFCYLGAYIGLWLGMSLLSISDLEDGIHFLRKHAGKKADPIPEAASN